MHDDPTLTVLLARLREGDESVREQIFGLAYDELHRLARRHMAQQKNGHTLGATALVNEAYLKLCHSEPPTDRGRFLRIASTAMRHILVDHARRKRAQKRGGAAESAERVELDAIVSEFEERAHGLVELDEALERLRAHDSVAVELVELRFFGGCTIEDAADNLEMSPRKAYRVWQMARGFLRREIDGG